MCFKHYIVSFPQQRRTPRMLSWLRRRTKYAFCIVLLELSILSPAGFRGPSALGLVLVGAHELHAVDGNVLLFDGLLHAALVLPEALGARVAAAVPLQELVGEPAVEALVVLPLQVRARLPDAVHVQNATFAERRRRKS